MATADYALCECLHRPDLHEAVVLRRTATVAVAVFREWLGSDEARALIAAEIADTSWGGKQLTRSHADYLAARVLASLAAALDRKEPTDA